MTEASGLATGDPEGLPLADGLRLGEADPLLLAAGLTAGEAEGEAAGLPLPDGLAPGPPHPHGGRRTGTPYDTIALPARRQPGSTASC